ncbi:MAG: DUF2059 domain-containing protein [Candidatus Omnitrophota bacterium]
MKLKLICLLMVLSLGCIAKDGFCDEVSKREKTEKLLILLKVDQQMAVTNERMKLTAKRQLSASNLPQNLLERMEKIFDKQFDLIAQATSWELTKNELIGAYSTVFTEEEIENLNNFYESDLGRKLVEKLPELFTKGMEIGQEKLLAKQSEIQKTMMEEWVKFEASLTEEERKLFQMNSVPANGMQN